MTTEDNEVVQEAVNETPEVVEQSEEVDWSPVTDLVEKARADERAKSDSHFQSVKDKEVAAERRERQRLERRVQSQDENWRFLSGKLAQNMDEEQRPAFFQEMAQREAYENQPSFDDQRDMWACGELDRDLVKLGIMPSQIPSDPYNPRDHWDKGQSTLQFIRDWNKPQTQPEVKPVEEPPTEAPPIESGQKTANKSSTVTAQDIADLDPWAPDYKEKKLAAQKASLEGKVKE